jgi:Fe-S cluster assembly ATPase SufC
MVRGQIVESGGPELAEKLEAEGYESWREVEEQPAA